MKTLFIGRDKNCDIVIEDRERYLSRKHAILTIMPDGLCTIEDIGSKNGVYVNGNRIPVNAPYYLAEGDTIFLAKKISLNWQSYLPQDFRTTTPLHHDATHLMEPEEIIRKTTPKRQTNEALEPHQHPSDIISSEKKPSVLTGAAVRDFFDKVIPVPGLSKNIMLFFNLHSRPITKILALIDQPDNEAEAHPFGFLGFSLLFYFGGIAYASSGIQEYEEYSEHSGNLIESNPVLMSFYFAMVVLITAWVMYRVFRRAASEKNNRSFSKFLKLSCLSQSMFLNYLTLILIMATLMVKRLDSSGNQMDTIDSISLIIFLILCFMAIYYVIVNIRVNRRFWGLSWRKFLPYLMLVGLISSLVLSLLTVVIGAFLT
jgi:hypothetical protein